MEIWIEMCGGGINMGNGVGEIKMEKNGEKMEVRVLGEGRVYGMK